MQLHLSSVGTVSHEASSKLFAKYSGSHFRTAQTVRKGFFNFLLDEVGG